MRRYPDHLTVQGGPCSLWAARGLCGDREIRLLMDPDRLFSLPECEVIKDQRKIKVGRVPVEIGGKTHRVYLKRYNAFSWRYRLLSLLAPSGAVRAWTGARILLGAGFHTGQPVAAVECRSWGMLTKSFYLSEEIPESKTVDVYWHQSLSVVDGREGFRRRCSFLKSLAEMFRSLHAQNIYHNDLKDANILVCAGNPGEAELLYLLDLEGIRRCRRLSTRRRIKNLVQLNRTLGRFLHASQRLYFLKAYLGPAFSDRKSRRKWVRRVVGLSRRRDRRSLQKG